MDVVLRAVNPAFLEQVAFAAFAVASNDRRRALTLLRERLADDVLHQQLDGLLESSGFGEVEEERFQTVIYDLLFSDWRQAPQGWRRSVHQEPWAAGLELTTHLTLMLVDPLYPYWDPQEAARRREQVVSPPWHNRGLPAFINGIWDGIPSFEPGEWLTTRGTNIVSPQDKLAVADWSYRPPRTVKAWSDGLPRVLQALMQREVQRLSPIDVPEADEVLGYWLGRTSEPPPLVVAFTGLGATSTQWVRELAALAAQIRRAAAAGQGLTSIITGGPRSWF